MQKHRVLSTLVEGQKSNRELVMTSVLIAIGVNLISTGITVLVGLENQAVILIIIGLVTCIGVFIKIACSKLKILNQTTEITGFMLYDSINKKIVEVPKYKLSFDMVKYLDWAFSENKALEILWKKDYIYIHPNDISEEEECAKKNPTSSGEILNELIEYCVIQRLSFHLSTYFNNHNEKPRIKEFKKVDVPDVLLRNRFLRLFSEEMRNRAAFASNNLYCGKESDGNVLQVYTKGALYSKFDLVLPQNSKVTSTSKNEITIETPILILKISCLFNGDTTYLPSDFFQYYLGMPLLSYYPAYELSVNVTVKFKIKSLFSGKKETYYSWIDSFLDLLTSYISKDYFFERIQWNVVDAIVLCNKNIIPTNKPVVQEQSINHND